VAVSLHVADHGFDSGATLELTGGC
jgi:hypothetical protein